MPKFSDFSENNLTHCHPDLVSLFREVIKRFDCRVLEGYRTPARQAFLYMQGRTRPGPIVTNVDGVNKKSAHNYDPSLAIHVLPYPVDWNNRDRNAVFAGYVIGVSHTLGINVRWGGDWNGNTILTDQTLHDWVHWELI